MNRLLDTIAFIQPYFISFLLLLVVLLIAPGCATSGVESSARSRDFATTAVMTAAGGYVGAKEGDGKATSAAGGAAAGYVVGQTINFLTNKSQRDAYASGYEKGQSDSVKQQYWIARANQRRSADDGYEEALYEIPVPQSERDGVRREASTRVIRVVVPKEDVP
jgi:hypothetical protein